MGVVQGVGSDMETIVELKNISKIYQQGEIELRAVDNVSLQIKQGDFAVLCGPSGSGKTSILNLIGGLDTPSSGQVFLDRTELTSLTNTALAEIRKNKIGFVFQAYNLIPVMTAYENAAFVLALQGVEQKQQYERVMQTLMDVGLAGLEHRRPDEMSGGQQQRVAIARAIVTRPTIVLADEPTANVDSHTAEALLDLMQNLNQQQGITFLFSSHDQHVIERAKRIIQIHDGKISVDEYRA